MQVKPRKPKKPKHSDDEDAEEVSSLYVSQPRGAVALSSSRYCKADTERPHWGPAARQALTPALSSRILQEAQAQQAEVDAEADVLAGALAASSGRQVAEPALLAAWGNRTLRWLCLSYEHTICQRNLAVDGSPVRAAVW